MNGKVLPQTPVEKTQDHPTSRRRDGPTARRRDADNVEIPKAVVVHFAVRAAVRHTR